MSSHITVTRTTTSTSTSAILLNTGYVRTWPAIFKFFQLVLGAVVIGLVGYYYENGYYYHYSADLFFLLIAVTFLIGTFLIFVSCLISVSTANFVSQSIYEALYHAVATILYLAASISFILAVNKRVTNPYSNINECYLAAAIIGFLITILYLLSTIYAMRTKLVWIIKR